MNDTNWFHDLTTDEARQERATLAQRVIAALGVVCLIVLVGLATNAYASDVPVHVFEDEAVRLQLFAAPCENEMAKQVAANSPLKDLQLQKAASAWVVQTPMGAFRIEYEGCWVAYTYNGRDGYAVAFEDKEIRFFPAEGFKKTKRQIGI
jgi:hypothetical protein